MESGRRGLRSIALFCKLRKPGKKTAHPLLLMHPESHTVSRLNVVSLLLIVFCCIFVVIVFMALGQFAYPSADDFCMAAGVRDEGFFIHLWHHYFEWSGRYSGNALYAAYPLIFGLFEGYALIAVFLIVLLYLSMVLFIASVFRLAVKDKVIWLVALVFICAYLLGIRHTASSLYWMAGALTYQSAHILLLLSLGVIVRLRNCARQNSGCYRWFVVLAFLIVLGTGTNEISMIVLLAGMGLVWLDAMLSRDRKLVGWMLLLLLVVLCCCVVYFSPGNTIRESTFPLRHDWLRSIRGSVDMGSWSLLVWTGNPVFITTTLLAPFAATVLYQKSGRLFKITTLQLSILALITFLSPFVLQFPAWWAMGGWPPPRSVDAIFFIFILSWMSLLVALTIRFMPVKWIVGVEGRLQFRASVVFFLVSIVFVMSVGISAKLGTALQDLRHHVKPFNAYMTQRHAVIEQSRQQGVYAVTVPAPEIEMPKSIYFNDIRADWRDWRNACYARYFRLSAIQRIKSSAHQ